MTMSHLDIAFKRLDGRGMQHHGIEACLLHVRKGLFHVASLLLFHPGPEHRRRRLLNAVHQQVASFRRDIVAMVFPPEDTTKAHLFHPGHLGRDGTGIVGRHESGTVGCEIVRALRLVIPFLSPASFQQLRHARIEEIPGMVRQLLPFRRHLARSKSFIIIPVAGQADMNFLRVEAAPIGFKIGFDVGKRRVMRAALAPPAAAHIVVHDIHPVAAGGEGVGFLLRVIVLAVEGRRQAVTATVQGAEAVERSADILHQGQMRFLRNGMLPVKLQAVETVVPRKGSHIDCKLRAARRIVRYLVVSSTGKGQIDLISGFVDEPDILVDPGLRLATVLVVVHLVAQDVLERRVKFFRLPGRHGLEVIVLVILELRHRHLFRHEPGIDRIGGMDQRSGHLLLLATEDGKQQERQQSAKET